MTFNPDLHKLPFAMEETFEKKCEKIKKTFAFFTPDERYTHLISLGRALPLFPDSLKTPENIVRGCQSTLYLACHFQTGKLFFAAHSDALISAGLAALLISLYSNETPETILTSPPTFLTDLNLSLSPTRSNGLYHIHLAIKQKSLKFLGCFKSKESLS